MNENSRKSVEREIRRIRSLDSDLEQLITLLRDRGMSLATAGPNGQLGSFWHLEILRHSLRRLRNFIANNTDYVESLSTLALCRYLFELVVWLKHIEDNKDFALFFVREHLREIAEHSERYSLQVTREIEIYEQFAELEDQNTHDRRYRVIKSATESYHDLASREEFIEKELADVIDTARRKTDEKLFLYSDNIAYGDFAFHAKILRTETLPELQDGHREQQADYERFRLEHAQKIEALGVKKWVWDQRGRGWHGGRV